jgi:peptide/nickel transport system permease protein
MPRFVLAAGYRIIHLVVVLLLVSFGTFMLLQLTPGDPAVSILGSNATPDSVRELHAQLGLNKPLAQQFGHWLGGAVHGDVGTSVVPPGGSVAGRIGQALPVSVELAVLAMVLALLFAIPIAVWSAYREGGAFDRIFSSVSFGLLSVPTFVSGLVLALLFSLQWRVLPRSEWVRLTSTQGIRSNLSHALLPAITLALGEIAVFSRLLRVDLSHTLREEFIATARAKGMPTRRVLIGHALRPSSFSLITLSGVSLGRLIGGTVIVEVIFGLPGIGSLLVNAVGSGDYPLVQGIVLVIAVIYVAINQVVDLSYRLIDPRTRSGRT